MRKLAVLVGVVLCGSAAIASAQQIEIKGFRQTIKMNQLLDGLAGPLAELNGKVQIRVAAATFEPGGMVGPHHHAGPGIRCVISGELTNLDEGQSTPTVFKAGDCFYESGTLSHTATNKSDRPAEVLVFEVLHGSHPAGERTIRPAPAK